MTPRPPMYGLMAEFSTATDVVTAARRAYDEGYRQMDAYTPFPVEGLARALGRHRTRMPLLVLIGGILGCMSGFFLQYYVSVHYYPLNVGGRPLNSWPAFIPITFELTVLIAGLFAVFGMLARNGLPMPYHPVFTVPAFVRASQDRFFLCIEATDAKFDREHTRQFLQQFTTSEVTEVRH